jgi:hypothetical protein
MFYCWAACWETGGGGGTEPDGWVSAWGFSGRRRVDRLEVEKLVVCAYEASERTIDAVC